MLKGPVTSALDQGLGVFVDPSAFHDGKESRHSRDRNGCPDYPHGNRKNVTGFSNKDLSHDKVPTGVQDHEKERDGDQGIEVARDGTQPSRQAGDKQQDAPVLNMPESSAHTQERDPDEYVAGRLFRPGKGPSDQSSRDLDQ